MILCAVFVSSLLLGVASGQDGGQLACSALNVNRPEDTPLSGGGLDVCRTAEDQCCTQSFLDGVKRQLGEDLLDGLREQITSRVEDIQDIVDRFTTYFGGDFIEDIRRRVPAAQFLSNLEDITSDLTAFLTRANFAISSASPERNTTAIFVNIVMRIEDAIRNSGVLNEMQQNCLVDELRMHVRQTSLVTLGRTLEVLRRSFSGIARIVQFLIRFNRNLDGFTIENFPAECVGRLTDISICGRCRRRIPPLCKNSCGALVRGCFAGFYSGLQLEFDNLWGVVRQLVMKAEQGVRELFEAENDLLDINLLQVVTDCNLQSLFGRRKRQAASDPSLPDVIIRSVERLFGVFNYSSSGPEFCELEREEELFCGGEGNSDSRSCDFDEVCTSTCQCWDGRSMRDDDITEFTGVGIEDQGDNPVISVPAEENLKIATSRSSVVNSFLTSEEFTEVMPEGVTIPPAATLPPATSTFGGDEGGSVPLVVSMVTVLGTVLFTLFVISV